jgi:hypothetical protein
MLLPFTKCFPTTKKGLCVLREMPTVEAAKRLEAEKQLAAAQEALAALTPVEKEYVFEPKPGTPIWASIVVGVVGAMAPAALAIIPPPWGPLVAMILGGVSLGLGTHFGIKSAGVAKTPGK